MPIYLPGIRILQELMLTDATPYYRQTQENGLDYYGSFPKNAPNGSGHSVQLGSDEVGNRADGLSYTFTVPAGQNEFSIFYQYAVVFANPGHFLHQQPRFTILVENLTDNTLLPCALDPFISNIAPGFAFSPNRKEGAQVMYKDWACGIN